MRIPYPPDAAHEITTKTPPFSSDKTVENGGSFIVKHIAVQDGKPVPYREFAPNIRFATDKIQVFTTNMRSKNNYALRITH